MIRWGGFPIYFPFDIDSMPPPPPHSFTQTAPLMLMLKRRATQNAACLSTLAQDTDTARRLFWIVYCPTSYRCLEGALRLLRALAGVNGRR